MNKSDKKLRSEVTKFLSNNGWARKKSKDGFLLRFSRDDPSLNGSVNIYLSARPNVETDVRGELIEAQEIIRQYYGMAYNELQNRNAALRHFGDRADSAIRDYVSSRIPDEFVFDDAIDFNIATSTISYLRSLIRSASAAVVDTSDMGKSEQDQGKNYLRSCRFGHTFRGSFGFQIECPISPEAQPKLDLFGEKIPVGRLVSERISRGLSSIQEASLIDDPSLIAKREKGMTGQMCGQLARYLEETQLSAVYLGVELDRGLPTDEFEATNTMRIDKHHTELLREAERLMSPVEEDDERPENVVGRVIVLKARGKPLEDNDKGKRQITVLWNSEEGSKMVVMNLRPDHYGKAIHAHENGLHVHIKGLLKKRGKSLELIDVEAFSVLS